MTQLRLHSLRYRPYFEVEDEEYDAVEGTI